MVVESYDVGCEIKFGNSDVNSLSFNPTGGLLAVCTCDRKIHLLGANPTGSGFEHLPVSPLNAKSEHHSYAVSCCTFSSLTPHLATCGIDGSLIVWDLLDVSAPNIFCKYQAGWESPPPQYVMHKPPPPPPPPPPVRYAPPPPRYGARVIT